MQLRRSEKICVSAACYVDELRTNGVSVWDIDVGPVVELRGSRGGLAPWKTWWPRETSDLTWYKPGPINPRLQHIILCIDAGSLQAFDPQNVTSWPSIRGLKKLYSLAIAGHIFRPLINYAIIRPLCSPVRMIHKARHWGITIYTVTGKKRPP